MSVAVATVAAFLAGGAYYSVVPIAAGDMPPWKLAVELGRCLILATVVAGLATRGDVDTEATGW